MIKALFAIVVAAWMAFGGAAWAQASPTHCGPDAAPAIAAAYGLTCEIFDPDMTNSAIYDVSDTRNPGYVFFTHNCPTCTPSEPSPTNPSDYTIDGSGLTMHPATTVYPGQMFSTCVNKTAAPPSGNYNGTTFGGSFYIDITYSISGTPTSEWAVPWLWPTDADTGTPTEEIDLFESPLSGGAARWLHEWLPPYSTYTYSYSAAIGGSVNGMLLVQPALNGGVGLIERATNDTAFDTLQWSPTMVPIGQGGSTGFPAGTFGALSHEQWCLYITDGTPQTFNISKIQVWGPPPGIGTRAVMP